MTDYLKELKIEQRRVKDKTIYTFESHHHALLPWSFVKRENDENEIILLSFDHHTDIHDPFLAYAYNKSGGKLNYDLMNKLIGNIDYHDNASIAEAIDKLKNDEHIKTAIRCGMLNHALIIAPTGEETPQSYEEKKRIDELRSAEAIMQLVDGTYRITPMEERTYPKSDIYMPNYLFDSDEEESDVLRDRFVGRHLRELSRISGLVNDDGTVNRKYILDIDLDYFHVPEAAEPREHELIGRLIKNAEIITIAKERICVDMCSEGKCNSGDLLEKIMRLIEKS